MPKLCSRICSFVLSAAMLLNMLPVNAFAEEADNLKNTDTITSEEAENAPVTVIGEVEDLREEDTKHFRLSNGNSIAVAYGMPVHYEDADGQWQDIDNRFSVDDNTQTLRVSTDHTAAVFSSSLNSGSLFTVSKGDHSVSMSLLDTAAAELMISGGSEYPKESMPEETFATEPEAVETTPEVTEALPDAVETVPESTETPPEIAETVPETTEAVPETAETTPTTSEEVPDIVETVPTEVSEETEDAPTTAEETVAAETQYVTDALLLSESGVEAVASVEEPTDSTSFLTENEVSSTEAASERITDSAATETVSETTLETASTEGSEPFPDTDITEVETTPETSATEETVPATSPTEETIPATSPAEETVPATSPTEETVPATSPTEETVPVTSPTEITESTIPETIETVPETTEETEPLDEISGDQQVFNRGATAVTVEDTPSMLTIQDSYDWDVTDVIPKNLQTSLRYSDVFPNTDFLYTAFGYNIKEQIIVKQPQSSYRYDFLVETNGLQPVLNDNGSISFNDADGNGVYSIPVPYMQDGADALSPNVTYTLTPVTQGVILTVTADAEWINAEDRVFPVMIDPTITIESGKALDEIYSVYTMEAAPNDTTLGRQYLYVGAQPFSTTNDGRYRLYMHFHNMPEIPAGSEVVDATLSLYQHQYTQRNCPSFPIGVYEVTTSLPSSYSSYYEWFTKMTWRRDQPEYDITNAIDYVMVDSTKTYRTWDMTELVKKWYAEGTSNTTAALVMMNESEIDTYGYYASAAFFAYASSIPPILIVSYKNNTGIEPYYTYATLGGASAGTAYVADATGQLKVGKELVSYASSTNPFSLNLVYNSDYFSMSPSTDYRPPMKLGLNMDVGTGWTLDCIQKVAPEIIDNVEYLKYTDGDGTNHYFVKDPSPKDANYPYYDEDGLCLKMRVDGSNNYSMADDNGNEWIFTGNYLTSIRDADGNQINIAYSNGQITSITQVNKDQPAIEVANFTYNGNTLSSVTDSAGNVYTLDYTSGNLTSIRKNSTTIAAYTYDGYRLTQMTDSESAYSLSFTYADGKISSFKELGGSAAGTTVSVSYPSHSQTIYRDSGNDRVLGNADDILTHYLFDYASRTANAYTTDNNGTILGATNAAYYEKSRTAKANDKRNNRTVRTASIGLASQQLLKNPSIENDNNEWTFEGTSRTTAKARTGSYAIGGTLTSNGNQFALRSSEELTSGKSYTLSAYVNTSGITRFDGLGIYLMVTDGTQNWKSNSINYITSDAVDDGWVRVSVTFTAPATDIYGISIFNSGSIGTFYADDFQLEEAKAPSSHNLLENGNFEMSNYGWTMGAGADISTSKGVAGSAASLKITGNPTDQTTNAYQDVNLNQKASQTYVLSGWVHANAVPDDDGNKVSDLSSRSKECGLRATITYTDATTEDHYAPFNTDLSNTWQFVSLTIVPKESAKTVSKIDMYPLYWTPSKEGAFICAIVMNSRENVLRCTGQDNGQKRRREPKKRTSRIWFASGRG